jgi:hypothetical protein
VGRVVLSADNPALVPRHHGGPMSESDSMAASADHRPAANAHPVGVVDGFVSYSRRDKSVVTAVVEAAQRRGRELWLDTNDIPPGVGCGGS